MGDHISYSGENYGQRDELSQNQAETVEDADQAAADLSVKALMRVIRRQSGEKRRTSSEETLKHFTTGEYVPEFIPGEKKGQLPPKRIRETVEHFLNHQRINSETNPQIEQYSEDEVLTAASLLEFLSSKPGKIRRTGSTYRNESYDTKILETILPHIHENKPITLFGLSFSPKFRNPDISDGQLRPDMANYLAMSNLQQIARGANMVYPGGVDLCIGYEGAIYRQLGKYSNEDVDDTKKEIIRLNDEAHRNVYGESSDLPNHVIVEDANALINSCLLTEPEDYSEEKWLRRAAKQRREVQSRHEFGQQVAYQEIGDQEVLDNLDRDGGLFHRLKDTIKGLKAQKEAMLLDDSLTAEVEADIDKKIDGLDTYGELESWKKFYLTTTSPEMFRDERERAGYAQRMAVNYKAFNEIKYQGGVYANGILGFTEKPVAITVNGTNRKMNIQLVPGWNYYPHHRLTARTIGKNGQYEWTPLMQKEMQESDAVFLPQYVGEHDYPFYYEQLAPVGNLDEKTSMHAGVQILQSENGQKYVAKTAEYGKGGDHLLGQIARMRRMSEANVTIIPEIVDANVKGDRIQYLLPFLDGESLDSNMFDGDPIQNTEAMFPTLLSKLSQELWAKGESRSFEHYFTDHHLSSVEKGLGSIEKNENALLPLADSVIDVDGKAQLNLPTILKILSGKRDVLDKTFATSICPEFTHGDLHFGNIFMKDGDVQLIDINGNPNRDVCSVDFELSRLMLSYYRQIIRDGEYSVETDENGNDHIEYTERGKAILNAREKAFQLLQENEDLKPFLTENTLDNIRLLEALDIASVFASRPEEQQEGTYLIGTMLLNEAIQGREDGMFDGAIFDLMRENVTVESYNSPETNQKLRQMFDAYLGKRYDGFSVSHMFNQFVVHAIKKDGTITSFLSNTDLIDGVDTIDTGMKDANGEAVVEASYDKILEAWQDQNFPENGRDKLFHGFAESENKLNKAIETGESVLVNGRGYKVKKLLGLGKESKAYEAEDEGGRKIAIKVGLQYLDKEFDYAMDLQEKSGEIGARFPQYYEYDRESNILSMELIEGQPAEEIIHQIDNPEDWTKFLGNISDVVADIAELNKKGVNAGQFNLRNVMVSDSGEYRIIDPLYEGNPDVYEAKQVLRIMGVLVEKIYHTKSERFPLRVKSSNQNETLRSLRYPDGALDELDGESRGIPPLLDAELQKVFRGALVNGIGNKTLSDVAHSFDGIKSICERLESNSIRTEFARRPQALAIDLNGTLEEDGIINARTVESINRLLSRGTPVAIISGKRLKAVKNTLGANGIDMSKIDVVSDEGAIYEASGEIVSDHTIANVEQISAAISQYIATQNIGGQVRNNAERINIALSSLDEQVVNVLTNYAERLGLEATVNQEIGQIDIVGSGVNKMSGMQEFASRHGIELDSIVTVGNEPTGNDREILFDNNGEPRPNSFTVAGSAETSIIIEDMTDLVGYGGIKRTGEIPAGFGMFSDFSDADEETIAYLRQTAAENSNIFYPYFALEQRLNSKDPKNVDYKWLMSDNDGNPIGFTSLNKVSEDGVYNISGMYLTPNTRGRGVATDAITTLERYATSSMPGFKGFRVRVTESNAPSRRIVEKSGFVPTEVIDGDYDLVINGEHQKAKTIVYEYDPSGKKTAINLAESGVVVGDELLEMYNSMREMQP